MISKVHGPFAVEGIIVVDRSSFLDIDDPSPENLRALEEAHVHTDGRTYFFKDTPAVREIFGIAGEAKYEDD